MSNPYFKFKKFTVYHDKCAMKVGTDGVILGAWVNIENTKKVLDIGTGCGLLALMIAQRNTKAQIIGVEIEKYAAEQAAENVANSEWSNRIKIIHADIKSYTTSEQFDVILSNPPFYNHHSSLNCNKDERNNARHTTYLKFDELLKCANNLLHKDGEFSVVIPVETANEVIASAAENQLYLSRKTVVRTLEGHSPKRILLSFKKTLTEYVENKSLTIEKTHHTYTDEFSELVKDFYIKL